ncbi:hypothetical protein INR49_020626 [Caranx melampygus]|nr:hypothetical protein INR49_020626 [Caranx melampygus]
MRQRMLKAQLDLSVPCPHTQDFQPCMGPGCSMEDFTVRGLGCEPSCPVHNPQRQTRCPSI